VLEHAAVPERRTILECLCEEGSCSLRELAERVVAEREDVEPSAVPDGAIQTAVISLRHNHLQQLAESGLVDLYDNAQTLETALSASIDPARVTYLLATGEGQWDELGVILSDPRRERIASLLASAEDRTLSLSELARAITALERGTGRPEDESTVQSTQVSIHHVHLPKLENTGLVEYDSEEGSVFLEELPQAYEVLVEPSVGTPQ
jgi:predicted transcriptional regulator